MKTTQAQIITVLKELKAEFSEKGIVLKGLFGSFAKGEDGVYSDIDIAISKDPDFLGKFGAYSYFETVNELRKKLIEKLHRPVDIFDLDSKSDIKNEIEKELIYV